MAAEGEYFDFRRLRDPPKTLSKRIIVAIEFFPCEIVFIHRDAETCDPAIRRREIETAVPVVVGVPHICIVPVRMTEAWLLFDERALRRAAGNPNGNIPLELPRLGDIEANRDPKGVLHDNLRQASGRSGRGLNKFSLNEAYYRLSEIISDYSLLRNLPAFTQLEQDVCSFLKTRKRT